MKLIKKTAVFIASTMMMSVLAYNPLNYVEADASSRTYMKYTFSDGATSYYTLTETLADSSQNARAIIGDNDMLPSQDTAVVHLSCGGSGFIIGDNVIVTAAHCLINDNGIVDNTVNIIGDNGVLIDDFNPVAYHIPQNYVTTSNISYDYGLIVLETNANLTQYGGFNLGVPLDEFMSSSANVTISGFPLLDEQQSSEIEGYEYGIRYQATGSVLYKPSYSAFAQRIYYDADTTGGTSGGPIFITEQTSDGTEYKIALGINTHEYNGQSIKYNSGVRMTSALLQFFKNNSNINPT